MAGVEWAREIAFEADGVRLGVRISHPDLCEPFPRLLPFGAEIVRSSKVERVYSVIAASDSEDSDVWFLQDDVDLGRVAGWASAPGKLSAHLQVGVAELTTRHVFVHAGAVGWRGWAIVIPGVSRAGKTTLVAELVRNGAVYYSDEYAVLDRGGQVWPFARPLSIRDVRASTGTPTPIEALGGSAGLAPLPIGLVVVTTYESGAAWRPERISTAHGALELLRHTPSALRQPENALETLRRAVSEASILKGTRGEAPDVVPQLLAACEERGG